MQLAYGRFDPDVNPPPFSEWSKSLTAVEIDLFGYYAWKPRTVAYFKAWIKRKGIQIIPRVGVRTQRSAEEYRDAIVLWQEEFQNQSLFFIVHSGRREWNPEQTLKELKKIPLGVNCFFEWGRDDSKANAEFIKTLECFGGWIVDPHWHDLATIGTTLDSLHFKLHGWSEERWIRRYGAVQAARVLRALKKHPESVLILAHSGKVAEAPLFKPVLEAVLAKSDSL